MTDPKQDKNKRKLPDDYIDPADCRVKEKYLRLDKKDEGKKVPEGEDDYEDEGEEYDQVEMPAKIEPEKPSNQRLIPTHVKTKKANVPTLY